MKLLRRLRYKLAGRFGWFGRRFGCQTCEDCYRTGRSSVWFGVPDDVWHLLRGDRHVLCLTCFDQRAQARGIDYRAGLVVEGCGSWLTGRSS